MTRPNRVDIALRPVNSGNALLINMNPYSAQAPSVNIHSS